MPVTNLCTQSRATPFRVALRNILYKWSAVARARAHTHSWKNILLLTRKYTSANAIATGKGAVLSRAAASNEWRISGWACLGTEIRFHSGTFCGTHKRRTRRGVRFPLTCSKSIGKMHADTYIREIHTSLVSRDSPRGRNTNKNVHALVSVSIAGEDFPENSEQRKRWAFYRWTMRAIVQTANENVISNSYKYYYFNNPVYFRPRHEAFEIEKKKKNMRR